MAIVREYGKPSYFITFTCNPNWPEITNSLFPGQSSYERSDIVARVFHMKWDALLHAVLKEDVLGHCDAYCAVKETQKRHLPVRYVYIYIVSSSLSPNCLSIAKG